MIKFRQVFLRFLMIAMALLLLASCQSTPTPQACTEIGCEDGLTIQLRGNVPPTFTLEVASPPGSEAVGVTCANGQAAEPGPFLCLPDGAFFSGVSGDEVVVNLIWDAGILSENMRPTYESVQPNGPECPPACRQGKLTIDVP